LDERESLRSGGTVKLSDVWLGGCGKGGYPRRMTTPQDLIYAGHRYPGEIISCHVRFQQSWTSKYLPDFVSLVDLADVGMCGGGRGLSDG
jgi:hypothetical protein